MINYFQNYLNIDSFSQAWRIVKRKNAAAGIDGHCIAEYDRRLDDNLRGLIERIRQDKWIPQPYLRIFIPKKDNERRQLGLLSIEDKIVQQTIKTVVEPILEGKFLSCSYGYRPDKGPQRAVRRVLHEMRQHGIAFGIKFDIDNFFDNVDHELLFAMMKQYIPDDRLRGLMELCMQMGSVNSSLKWAGRNKGIPQGAVLSPLLANLYLNSLDHFIFSFTKSYIRYADDFVILCEKNVLSQNVVDKIAHYLQSELKLSLNDPIVNTVNDGIDFLGLHISKSRLSLTEQKTDKIKSKIKRMEFVGNKISPTYNLVLQGLKRYYGALLPGSYSVLFDQELIKTFRDYCVRHSIVAKSQIRAMIGNIEFFTSESHQSRREICENLISELTTYNKKEKGLSNKIHIKSRKIEYQRKENENSELIVSSFGYSIGVGEKGITMRRKGEWIPTPPSGNLKHIIIMSDGVSISSNAITYCTAHDIPIDFFNFKSQYIASLLSPKYIRTTLWMPQSCMQQCDRVAIAKKIVLGKLKNQINLVKYFHKYHSRVIKPCEEIFGRLNQIISKVKNFSIADDGNYQEQLMALEAQGATIYWKYVRLLVEDDGIVFETRQKHGPADLFNSMLNYGYAILYPRIWQNIIRHKLNPYDGFLHYQTDKPNLVFDLIELFRAQAVDRIVITMIQKKLPLGLKDGLLDDKTKSLLIKNVIGRINRYEHYRGKEMHFYEIIQSQVQELSAFITDHKTYRPYIAKW